MACGIDDTTTRRAADSGAAASPAISALSTEGSQLAERGAAVSGELLHAGPGVLEPPHTADAAVGEAEEVHLVDSHRSAGGLEALPGAHVCAGASEPGDNGGAFGYEFDDLLVPVRERGEELGEGGAQLGHEIRGAQLVEQVELPPVHHVVDEPSD